MAGGEENAPSTIREAVRLKNRQSRLDTMERLGFKQGKAGAHLARTMMLDELTSLLAFVDRQGATRADFERAIKEDNCLGKPSAKARVLTTRHLVDLYALDPSVALFRNLLFFWERDPEGRKLIALLCAYARDPILRLSAPIILEASPGQAVSTQDMADLIEKSFPGRFSPAMLKSAAQNLNGTWTSSGHLTGKRNKSRSRVSPTAGAIAYALLLGYLTGAGGLGLFGTEYASLLDCGRDKAIDLAEEAARKGWITFKRVGDVIELGFRNLITDMEREWLRELC